MSALMFGFLKFLVPFVVGAVTHALHLGRKKERDFIANNVRSERLREILLHFDDIIAMVVKELFQTMAKELRLSNDGKLTPEARKVLRTEGIDRVRKFAGGPLMVELGKLLRIAEGVVLQFLGSRLEAKVYDEKRRDQLIAPDVAGIHLTPPALAG